jgi:hypothetical protein
MMSFWDGVASSIGSVASSIGGSIGETKAKKTNNYDKYNDKVKNTKSFIGGKREMMRFVLEQKEFKALKKELDKYKRSL